MLNVPFKIRNATISDLTSIREILKIKELGWTNDSLDYLKRLIDSKEGIFLVVEDKSKIIGVIYGEFNEKEDWAMLEGIGILEQYRRQGIGTQLINEFEKIIKNKDISNIELFAHSDTLAKHIHELGYKKGGNYIYFTKKLKNF